MKEADLKSAVSDYLTYKQNQGELYFDRLNSGDFIEVRGNTRRRIKGCRKGTADFYFIESNWINAAPTHINVDCCCIVFLECKSDTGKQSPEQKEFQILVEAQGAEYYIVRSIEDLEERLEQHKGDHI